MSDPTDPRQVALAGCVLGSRMVRDGTERGVTELAQEAWLDLPVEEGRWLTTMAAGWMATFAIPRLVEAAAVRGVDLRPELRRIVEYHDPTPRGRR